MKRRSLNGCLRLVTLNYGVARTKLAGLHFGVSLPGYIAVPYWLRFSELRGDHPSFGLQHFEGDHVYSQTGAEPIETPTGASRETRGIPPATVETARHSRAPSAEEAMAWAVALWTLPGEMGRLGGIGDDLEQLRFSTCSCRIG